MKAFVDLIIIYLNSWHNEMSKFIDVNSKYCTKKVFLLYLNLVY